MDGEAMMRRAGIFMLAALLLVSLALPAGARVKPRALNVDRPEQFTFEARSVLYADVSPDGRLMACTRESDGFTGLWLRSADPATAMIPRRLTPDAGNHYAPRFSRDGRFVAFVGTLYDAKGDIYVLDLKGDMQSRRLTGRDTADGGPCFSPDGKTIYYHRTVPGKRLPELTALDIDSGHSRSLNVDSDGAFPAISPDGTRIAFVARTHDPAGDILVLDRVTGTVTALTSGPDRDLYPRWSADGRYVYFTRGEDTPRIMRIGAGEHDTGKSLGPWPVTSGAQAAYQPVVAAGRLYYLSESDGVGNVWTLPQDGPVPGLGSAEAQLALARDIAISPDRDTGLTVLGYSRVLERFGNDAARCTEAAYRMGRVLEGMKDGARRAEQAYARASVGPDSLYSGLAEVAAGAMRARASLSRTDSRPSAKSLARQARTLVDIGDRHADPRIRARARIEAVRLYVAFGTMPRDLTAALILADEAIRMADAKSARSEQAEALVLKGDVYARSGAGRSVVPLYERVVREYPGQEQWTQAAAMRLLDRAVAGMDSLDQRMGALLSVASGNEAGLPVLAALAWNRMGDEYHRAGEDQQAANAYSTTLAKFSDTGAPVVAARMALAEILYDQERFQRALDLYETEMAERPAEDRIYRLARAAYLQRSAAAGQHLLRLGEVSAARSVFAELVRYAPDNVPAHRGVVQCAAAMGILEKSIDKYSDQLEADPENDVLLYSLGLALTYRDSRADLERARDLIAHAVRNQGQVSYYHQTLGYVHEVLETVHGVPEGLEKALLEYRTARFLNDARLDAQNAADLDLNVGNACFLLGQYERAFRNYQRRLASGRSFGNTDQEIVFYQRLGRAAFQAGEPQATVDAFNLAIQLVDEHADPRLASRRFGVLGKYVLDSVLRPLMGDDAPEQARNVALVLAREQAELNNRAFALGRVAVPMPPSGEWLQYRAGMVALIADQQRLNRRIVDRGLAAPESVEAQTMQRMAESVREALDTPGRYGEMQAELQDRLGLALQENGQHAEARLAFLQAFDRNEALGRTFNLAVNLRSAAYNAWLLAGDAHGLERKRLLQQAHNEFGRVVALVKEHGVPERGTAHDNGGALISVNLRIALDETTATHAMDGFSPEQEIRLARTFMTRIATELGRIAEARRALEAQLPETVVPAKTPAGRRFGTGLALHRAAHLARAVQDPLAAFERFAQSADMGIAMGTATSAALNVMNMAQCLRDAEPSAGQDRLASMRTRFVALVRRVTRLVDRLSDGMAAPGIIAPEFHNAVAVAFNDLAQAREAGAVRSYWLSLAMGHANGAVEYFEENPPDSRQQSALLCAALLNRARLGDQLGLPGKQDRERVLTLCDDAFLPDFRWRALAASGRLPEALNVLRSLPLSSMHAGQGEIIAALASLVRQQVDAGNVEQAFDLAEELSELERVNRTACLGVSLPQGRDADLLARIAPRLLRIRELRQRLDSEQEALSESQRDRVRSRLEQEQEILVSELGPDRERLPGLARLASGEDEREWLLTIMGMAVRLERAADEHAAYGTGRTLEIRQAAVDAYSRTVARAAGSLPFAQPPGVLGFIVPLPAMAFDVMENLGPGRNLMRAFPAGDGGWIVFSVRQDVLSATLSATLPESADMLAVDFPSRVPAEFNGTLVLSGTHFVRSAYGLKPFKRRLLALDVDLDPVPQFFATESMGHNATVEQTEELAGRAQTLVLGNPVHAGSSVPVRRNRRAMPGVLVHVGGTDIPMAQLAGRASNVSLAMIADSGLSVAGTRAWSGRNDVYEAGCVASLFGLPSMTFMARQDMPGFLQRYARMSPQQAMASQRGSAGREGTAGLLLGHPGLAPDQALELAREQFGLLAGRASRAYQAGQYEAALAAFEDCITIALESGDSQHAAYLPQLYAFARTSAYEAGQLSVAVRHGQALVELLQQEAPDSAEHARAVLQLGLVHARAEQFALAMPLLERAVGMFAALDMGPEQVRAMDELGTVLENAVRYQGALRSFADAATVSDELMADELLARQYMNMGRVRDLRLSQYALAKQDYAKALEIHELMGDAGGMAQARLDMGRCDRLMGDFAGADELLQQAMDSVRGDGEDAERMRMRVLMEQANNAWYRARYQQAFDMQRRVLEYARTDDWPLMRVIARNTAGMIWWTLGDHERALRELERAEQGAHGLAVRKDILGSVLNNKGLVLRDMGRLDASMAALEKALETDRALESRWAEAYDLRNMGQTLLRMGDVSRAVDMLVRSLDMARSIGNRINVAKILVALGQAHAARPGNDGTAKARQCFAEALDLSRGMRLREYEWRALHGLARLDEQRGGREAARQRLETAVNVIEDMRAEIRMERLRDGFALGKAEVYGDLVRILADMGREADAFYVAERSRARNLIDLLGNRNRNLRGGADSDAYNALKNLKARIVEQERLATQAVTDDERRVYSRALGELQDRYTDLLLNVQADNPELADMVSVHPMTLEQVQQAMEPDTAMLVYYTTRDELFCWVVSPREARLVRKPVNMAELGEDILQYRRMLQNLEPAAIHSRRLYDALLAPVLDTALKPEPDGSTRVRALGIVPHGPLHYLSFATLGDEKAYLVERAPLFYLPSASVMRYTFARRDNSVADRVLAVGNPDFGDPSLALPFAGHEVRAIAWNHPGMTLLSGSEATRKRVVQDLGRYGIIHLATHGEFDAANPLFSAIRLAPDSEQDNGQLSADEVFELDINADLVVLSACQTGLGKVGAGDDVVGMNRSFLYAGTHALASSLWRVSDVSTAILMKQFYREYPNRNKAESLQRAMLHVFRQYAHPGYWGAFVLVGDYQ
jgi:CHAT domain-containing protein